MGRLILMKAMAVLFGLFLVGMGVTYADDTQQKFSDPAERSLEAGSVSLIQSASGRVVEVRVRDCELCDRASYLPRRNLEVMMSGESIRPESFSEFSGRAATIVFDQKDYMIFGVYYWASRQVEDSQ